MERPGSPSRQIDARVQRWLRSRDGVITRAEAHAAGLTDNGIRLMVARGQWMTVHRGVYLVAGIPMNDRRRLRTAIAAVGSGAVASHLSAAWLFGLTAGTPPVPVVTVERSHRPRLAEVIVHRSLLPVESCQRRGLWCTGPLRTLIDCATEVPPPLLADLLDRALAGRIVSLAAVDRRLNGKQEADDRLVHHRGRSALRHCLEERGLVGGPAPSVLESNAARLFRRYGLPVPGAEVVWGDQQQYRLDFAFTQIRLMIEVDGYAWHASPERMQYDHKRRNHLVGEGWTVLVYTWRDITTDPDRVAREVRAAHRHLARTVSSPSVPPENRVSTV